MKKVWVLSLAILTFAVAQQPAGQQPVRMTLTDVPLWDPASKEPPAKFADTNYVYLDLSTQEYVISYPMGLERGETTGPRLTFRHEPGWVVDPDVSVAIKKDPSRGLTYEYSVRNGPSAKREIRFFKIVVPSQDDELVMEHPRWLGNQGSPNVAPLAGLRDPRDLRVRANMGKWASWTSSNRAAPIAPGAVESGFRLNSAYRPGITSAYSTNGSILAPPYPLPGPVLDQIQPLMLPEKDEKIVLTFGPKFGPGGPQSASWVANDYLYGIQRLILAQRLSADSPFVKELQAALRSITENPSAIEGREDPTYAPVKLASTPSTQLERELEQAVWLAFQP